MGAYYSYRMVQYKMAVGGWWNLVLGRSPPAMYMPPQRETQPNTNWNGWRASKPVKGGGEDGVEVHIQGLAKALGMPTNELASAIASAVRAYVPPASLSSVAAKETGEAVKVLLQEPSAGETRTAKNKKIIKAGSGGNVMDNIISGMDAVVGMDDA
ncbi:hypothetical protein CPB84DRAFT_1777942 [Gymnopilus junonius]|uniref:Uncharacterized protein n=1 Tax=Gymnopilus junonius TaxID=109634 RepID=A0A9P5TMI9_GYMJU|nr:hypothetical protein CPB84DRAFT_1777942 [Gymnopilus junonius]